MEHSISMWLIFLSLICGLLALDLGVWHRKQKAITVSESIKMSIVYIGLGLMFGLWVYYTSGYESAVSYLTAFLVEKSLALDNVFVILMIFSFFAIPPKYQHRVLFWGIFGVIILRTIMILLSAKLIQEFSWVLYIFSFLLIVTGIKMLIFMHKKIDIQNNYFLKFLLSNLNMTKEIKNEDFFIIKKDNNGKSKIWVTPLFVSLLMIEIVDLLFAIDSIPAVFAITTDTYIVYTSNIFAILGLRALYFALAAVIQKFTYIKPALAIILIFIGSKIFVADIFNIEKISPIISLSITIMLLSGGVLLSLYKEHNMKKSS